jgi:hypothetical protein
MRNPTSFKQILYFPSFQSRYIKILQNVAKVRFTFGLASTIF